MTPSFPRTTSLFSAAATAPLPAETAARLREVFTGYYTLHRQLNDVEPEDPELHEDALGLSFHVSAAIECDPGVKQRLLVERSTTRRVEALLLLVPILAAGVESALRIHRRAHTNGRGGLRPDVITEPRHRKWGTR